MRLDRKSNEFNYAIVMSEEKAVFLNGYDRYLVRVIEYSVPGHLYPENALERHLKE